MLLKRCARNHCAGLQFHSWLHNVPGTNRKSMARSDYRRWFQRSFQRFFTPTCGNNLFFSWVEATWMKNLWKCHRSCSFHWPSGMRSVSLGKVCETWQCQLQCLSCRICGHWRPIWLHEAGQNWNSWQGAFWKKLFLKCKGGKCQPIRRKRILERTGMWCYCFQLENDIRITSIRTETNVHLLIWVVKRSKCSLLVELLSGVTTAHMPSTEANASTAKLVTLLALFAGILDKWRVGTGVQDVESWFSKLLTILSRVPDSIWDVFWFRFFLGQTFVFHFFRSDPQESFAHHAQLALRRIFWITYVLPASLANMQLKGQRCAVFASQQAVEGKAGKTWVEDTTWDAAKAYESGKSKLIKWIP